MNKQEILQKAIQKAIDGGYINGIAWLEQVETDYQEDYGYQGLIFNHDFAKALWGDYIDLNLAIPLIRHGATLRTLNRVPAWQYHLQQMVIADDPIKYLGQHIDISEEDET